MIYDRHPDGPMTNRCANHRFGYNWPYTSAFLKCPLCGEKTKQLRITNGVDEVMSEGEAVSTIALVKQTEAAEFAKAAEQQAKDDEARERLIRAATAALRYDLDHWMEADPMDLLK